MTTISALSTQYVKVPVSATVAGAPYNFGSDLVQLAIVPVGSTAPTWALGSWEAVAGVYSARLLVGPSSPYGALQPGVYTVLVRVTDNPETPVLQASGVLQVQ